MDIIQFPKQEVGKVEQVSAGEWGEIYKEYGSGSMNKTPKTDIKGGSKENIFKESRMVLKQ